MQYFTLYIILIFFCRSKVESGYNIVSAYPNKTHDDNSKTLEASGLTPNAVLHLRPKRGSTS